MMCLFSTAFDTWKRSQMTPLDLAIVFKTLSKYKKLFTRFPEVTGRHDPKENPPKTISSEDAKLILKNVLNEILATDPGNQVSDAEVAALIDEISSSPDGSISFDDFLRIFT